MLLRRKTKKIILIILCSFLGFIAISVIAFLIYAAQIPLDNYYSRGHFIYFGDGGEESGFSEDDRIRMQEKEGYHVNYPWFEDTVSFNTLEEWDIYNEIIDPLQCYAMDVSYTYRNYAKLDFAVSLEKDMLTIAFTGWGYPDEGKGEPECLDKVYVFDVSNVSVDNLPRLVSETATDPDAVYEYMQALMRGNLKWDSENDIWYEKQNGEWVEIDGPPIRHK